MAIEVMVTHNPRNFSPYAVEVYVSNKMDHNTRLIMHISEGGLVSWDPYNTGQEAVHDDAAKPTYRIPVELIPEITRALASHQGGLDDTRQLRKDYDHEQKRRDILEDAVIAIAAGQTITPTMEMRSSEKPPWE